jgi:hypothetical protein
MHTLVFERNRGQSVLMLAGSLAFVALGLWMLLADPDDFSRGSPMLIRFGGAASVLFFGATLIGWGSNALRRSPALVLGPEGLRINSGIAGRAVIPCADIREFRVVSSKGPALLVVRLHDPDAHARQAGPLRSLLDRINLQLCGSPVAIGDNVFRDYVGTIAGQCNAWLERWRTHQRRTGAE